MAKGQKTGGRKKGTPNKSDSRARAAIAKFVEVNSEKFEGWLDEIYEEHGAKEAFSCVTALIEYHIPKLARTELTGKEGEDLEFKITKVVHSARDQHNDG